MENKLSHDALFDLKNFIIHKFYYVVRRIWRTLNPPLHIVSRYTSNTVFYDKLPSLAAALKQLRTRQRSYNKQDDMT